MKLYLVQHGKARAKEIDPGRSLSEEGKEELLKVAAFTTANTPIKVSRIYHSGKTRAKQTADFLAEHIMSSGGTRQVEGLEPMTDPSIWAEKLKQAEDDIMLVGHLPHLSRLASLLITGTADLPVINFCNAGIVCLIGNDGDHWSASWIVTPDILK